MRQRERDCDYHHQSTQQNAKPKYKSRNGRKSISALFANKIEKQEPKGRNGECFRAISRERGGGRDWGMSLRLKKRTLAGGERGKAKRVKSTNKKKERETNRREGERKMGIGKSMWNGFAFTLIRRVHWFSYAACHCTRIVCIIHMFIFTSCIFFKNILSSDRMNNVKINKSV